MRLFAIDPGYVESAWVLYDTSTRLPVDWRKEPNEQVTAHLGPFADVVAERCVIEMVASYGMPVGAEVFETCVWVGRFMECWGACPELPSLVYRRDVKLHLCGQARAKDSNIRQALIDRYGPSREAAIGRKAAPGPLYGVKADCWQALALAITAAETDAGAPLAVAA